MKFDIIDWRSAYNWLEIKQIELIKAYEKNDKDLVLRIQVSILKDFRTTVIVKLWLWELKAKLYKPTRIELNLHLWFTRSWRTRVLISPMQLNKSGFLKAKKVFDRWGRFTIQDRIVQAVYLQVIDPIVETQSYANSYGIKKFRSAKDAVLSLWKKLIHPKSFE